MIAYVEGRLAQAWDHACVVVTEGGVGYEIALPAHAFSRQHVRLRPQMSQSGIGLGPDARLGLS